jgi:methenyltetrahydromethanopterin cyclohydrolase
MVQIIARVLEVALHKVHALGFPLGAVLDGAGSAPLAPPAPDFLTAMGRSNDAMLFGGSVRSRSSPMLPRGEPSGAAA